MTTTPVSPANPPQLRSTSHLRTGTDWGLQARSLSKSYGSVSRGPADQQGPLALCEVSLDLRPGESLAVMGPSGSGKTTLLHCLAGILTPSAGAVYWRGRDIVRLNDQGRTRLRRTDFGFVFQSGQLLPELPAVENAALPLMLAGVARREACRRAAALFPPLGLSGLEGRRPGELSGGQAQRVAIARAVAAGPGLVFADEPTGALDQQTGAEVMHYLSDITARSGSALVVVTHDAGVARWCSRTITMRDGRIAAQYRANSPTTGAGLHTNADIGTGGANTGGAEPAGSAFSAEAGR